MSVKTYVKKTGELGSTVSGTGVNELLNALTLGSGVIIDGPAPRGKIMNETRVNGNRQEL
jgi:hypothetical protein